MKPRHRMETPYKTEETRAAFLYGRPNRGKQEAVRKAQEKYASMVNGYTAYISSHPELLVYVIKNDHKAPGMRKAEKSARPKDVNSAFSQNAFDQACTLLSSRLDAIRTDMLRTDRSFLVRSKVLFAMTLQSKAKEEMEDAVRQIISAQKRPFSFHEYYKEVEPSFAGLSGLRNKKRKICHFIRKHKSLPDDVRRSLIGKADRLERMIRTSKAPYRKKRRYYQHLDEEIRRDVDGYISSIDKGTVTVLEKLDIKEFHKGRKANGRMSTFAKGKLQKKLMEELNWHGYAFAEVEPDYTSQVCPVCGNLKAVNRSGKLFRCTCCGYKDDADHVGALNIRNRAADDEVLSLCEKYRYQHRTMQKSIVSLYEKRHRMFLMEHPMPMPCLPKLA